MNEKHICDVLESLHQRLFTLESYNHSQAITKLNMVNAEYIGTGRARATWSMRPNLFNTNPVLNPEDLNAPGAVLHAPGAVLPNTDTATGGYDYLLAMGKGQYANRFAMVKFSGFYRVSVRLPHDEFIQGPAFTNPHDVLGYLDHNVFPIAYSDWIRPNPSAI